MFPKTDKSWIDYRALTKNDLSALIGHAIVFLERGLIHLNHDTSKTFHRNQHNKTRLFWHTDTLI